MKRSILVTLGLVAVGLGVLGIFLPLLPTTPFLLLAAYLFAKGSDRWHRWLLNHRHLGPYIHAFRNKTGLTKAQKIRMGASFTAVMAISIYFVPTLTGKVLLGGIWAFWTFMLVRMKSFEPRAEAARVRS